MNAGFWIRFGANLLDGIITFIPLGLISLVLFGSFNEPQYFKDFLSALYSIFLPVIWEGRTIGKKVCKIRIQKLDGSTPGVGTMLLRVLVGGIVYAITFGIAAIVSAFMVGLRADKRAIHDFIAGTMVVRDPDASSTMIT